MIKTIINKAIRAVLDELFLDAPSVKLSMGADLFSDSKINLSNLRFRPDIFDISLQPFSLVAGHVGSLNLEGIAELALGGNLRFQAENIFLLFRLDGIADPEKIQTMKKILIELQSGKFSTVLLSDLLRKLQGITLPPDTDIKEKRKVIYKTFDSMSKGAHLTVKGIHVRFEFNDENLLHTKCNSLGFMIPLIKVGPSPANMRPEGVSKYDPVWLVGVKGFQLYVDYNRTSYEGESFDQTVELFKNNWRTEVHTVMISPLDVDLVIGVNLKRNSGLICPHIAVSIPTIKLSLDEKQMQVLQSMTLKVAKAQKKYLQHVKIQKIYRKGFPLPRMYEVGGIRFLPHLTLRGLPYPSKTEIPLGSIRPGLVQFMKDRVGGQWKVMLWKFAIRSVMHDLQRTRPLGRWVEIIRLLFIRRDYAFTYAKLLKRSPDSGNFIFNVNAITVSANTMRQLFEYEMLLSIQAVHMFRTLAYLIAMVGYQHMKRKAFSTRSPSANEHMALAAPQSWEKLNITWRDLLLIYTELYETQRESSFHRFDRSGQEDDVEDYYYSGGGSGGGAGGGFDSASVRSGYSSGLPDDSLHHTHAEDAADKRKSVPRTASSSWLGVFSGWTSSSSASTASSSHGAPATDDEYDKKFMKKFDLSAFGDALGGLVEKVDRARGDGTDSIAIFSNQVEAVIKGGVPLPNTRHPTLEKVSEAVQWAINKHKSPVTIMPPDISFKTEKCVFEVKTPSSIQQKERVPLMHAAWEGIQATVNISQSSSNAGNSNNNNKGNTGSDSPVPTKKEVRGFASLTGALVQFRLVMRQFSFALAVPVARAPGSLPTSALFATTAAAEAGVRGKEGKRPASTSALNINTTKGSNNAGPDDDNDADSVTSSITTSTTNTNPVPPSSAPGGMKTPDGKSRPVSFPATVVAGGAKSSTTGTTMGVAAGTAGAGVVALSDVLGTPPRTTAPSNQFRGPYTIHTPIDDTLGVVSHPYHQQQSKSGGGGGRKELREVLSSAPAENIFVFCLILDLDDRGEGAGDVQVQLGGMRMDFARRTLTALYDPLMADTFQRIGREYANFAAYLPFVFSSEESLIIDWEERIPYVMLACDPPVSVLNRLAMQSDHQRRRQRDTEEEAVHPVTSRQQLHHHHQPQPLHQHQHQHQMSNNRKSDSSNAVVAGAPASKKAHTNEEREREKQALRSVMIDGELSRIDHALEHQNVSFIDHPSSLHTLDTDISRIVKHSEDSTDEAEDEFEAKESAQLLGAMAGEREEAVVPMDSDDEGYDNSLVLDEDDEDNEQLTLTEDDEEIDGRPQGLSLEERRSRRAAIVFNKNLMHWLGTMEAMLPRVVTFCLRTSPIVLQSLEAMVIRDLVYAKMHAVLDQAAQRQLQQHHHKHLQRSFFGASPAASSMFSMDSVWGILGHLIMATAENMKETRPRGYTTYTGIRKWGTKRSGAHLDSAASIAPTSASAPTTSLSSFKIKALIPAVEVVVAKALVPYPALDVHVQGMAVLKVPMSDETLCHYLAWFLAEYCPVHTL